MERRQVLETLGKALLGLPLAVRATMAGDSPRRKVLLPSPSVLFEHPVRKGIDFALRQGHIR